MSQAILDTPVTDKELEQFNGVTAEDTSAADMALRAIRAINLNAYTPEVCRVLIACLASQISHSPIAHIQTRWVDVVSAVEALDDAHSFLGE